MLFLEHLKIPIELCGGNIENEKKVLISLELPNFARNKEASREKYSLSFQTNKNFQKSQENFRVICFIQISLS